ncbi:hypothetical protein ACS0TY_035052 [Phlomoides rotata]
MSLTVGLHDYRHQFYSCGGLLGNWLKLINLELIEFVRCVVHSCLTSFLEEINLISWKLNDIESFYSRSR